MGSACTLRQGTFLASSAHVQACMTRGCRRRRSCCCIKPCRRPTPPSTCSPSATARRCPSPRPHPAPLLLLQQPLWCACPPNTLTPGACDVEQQLGVVTPGSGTSNDRQDPPLGWPWATVNPAPAHAPAQVSPAAAMNPVVCLFPNELYRGAFDVTHGAVFVTRGPQWNVYDHAYAGTSLNRNCPFILLWG